MKNLILKLYSQCIIEIEEEIDNIYIKTLNNTNKNIW